jgi:hypothetical protein
MIALESLPDPARQAFEYLQAENLRLRRIVQLKEEQTCLDFPNFDCRMTRTPALRSTSRSSNAAASPGRNPVAASKPIRVFRVSAFILRDDWRASAASISWTISASL